MRPWLVQEPGNATVQPLVSGSQQRSDGGIYASLLTMEERPQLRILGKMNLCLLGSVVCLKHQGWDIWAAASHPTTRLTPPRLVNPHAAPRGVLGETARRLGVKILPSLLREASWCDTPALKRSTFPHVRWDSEHGAHAST